MAVPASRNLRVTTGVLLLLGGLAAIVFPFISALAVTIGFGAVALAAGVPSCCALVLPLMGAVKRFACSQHSSISVAACLCCYSRSIAPSA